MARKKIFSKGFEYRVTFLDNDTYGHFVRTYTDAEVNKNQLNRIMKIHQKIIKEVQTKRSQATIILKDGRKVAMKIKKM